MDWNNLLNQVIYPAAIGLILVIAGAGLKILASWLKIKAEESKNTLFKSLATSAVGAIEQAATVAEKAGETKWSGEKKKTDAIADVKATATAKGLVVTDAEINKMIESVLGEKKL
jgi:hypothetical protein